MNEIQLSKLIQYLVEQADNCGHKVTTIYLVKLLYLVDIFHTQFKDAPLTNWKWYFHNYGPWTSSSFLAIQSAIKQGYVHAESHESKYGNEDFSLIGIAYSSRQSVDLEIQGLLGMRVDGEIKRILKRFKGDTHRLLNFVYEETEPMKQAVPGETLDFGLIRRTAAPTTTTVATEQKKITPAHLKAIRQAISKMTIADQTNAVTHLQPIYDQEYFDSINSKDSIDSVPESAGTTDISHLFPNRKASN